MNLERLYIENYKQLRDPVLLPPPEGAIGVVDPTAWASPPFESILWAFFGSKAQAPASQTSPSPGAAARRRTRRLLEVTLTTGTTPTRQASAQEQRHDRRGARPGRQDRRDGRSRRHPLGRGRLLRMDRTTFEATFYAKQKELRFFAHDDGISRVRRISKMLGISGVEAPSSSCAPTATSCAPRPASSKPASPRPTWNPSRASSGRRRRRSSASKLIWR